MERELRFEQAVKIDSFNGIDVYRIDTDKFKTNSINFFFLDDLTRDSVTKNALLPAVMRRGSTIYSTSKEISAELEQLYGAIFDCGVTKKGEKHIIQFYIEFLAQQFIHDDTDSFTAAFDMLYNIITEPDFQNDCFNESYLEQEKDNLRKLIESRVNDKMTYSLERCLEEMCKDEPYSIYDYGLIEDIDVISPKDLAMHHKTVLESYPLQVYVTGSISDRQIELMIGCLKKIRRRDLKQLNTSFSVKPVLQIKDLTERMSVAQAKLCVGFRTDIAPDSEDYQSLMVYNGILGGGVHSKLFQNVREKASLAYYAFSRLEKFKGLMVVSSGIEFKNRGKTLEIMLKQIEDMKKGLISQEELSSTVKNIETGLKSLRDSQMSIVDFYLSQAISGTDDSFEDVIKKIKAVTVDDVVRVASGITLDTIYMIAGQED